MNKKFKRITFIPLLLSICLLSSSCFKRELDENIDYMNIQNEESIKDNEYLRFKTFRVAEQESFIIFGHNNEVSINGEALLPLYFLMDRETKPVIINLMGCIYEYDNKEGHILFRDALIQSRYLENTLVADVGFSFTLNPKNKNGLDLFTLKLKSIKLAESGETLMVGDRAVVDGKTIAFMSEFAFTLIYYKN